MKSYREQLGPLFEAFPRIQLAYLFGSEAIENTHPESDIDIAILTREPLSLQEESRLAASISQLTSFNKVDIVDLQRSPSLLKYEAIANGRLVYQTGSDEYVNQFEMSVYREYFHTQRMRNLQYQLLIEEA